MGDWKSKDKLRGYGSQFASLEEQRRRYDKSTRKEREQRSVTAALKTFTTRENGHA